MNRTSTVYVSKEDKKLLQKYSEEIGKILEKYPYSNDYSEHFVTTMTRLRNTFSELSHEIDLLDVK